VRQTGTESQIDISVAILAGGQSRRLGVDKALLRFGEMKAPLISRVIERVSALSGDIRIIGNGRRGYERFGIPVVEDLFGVVGALGGLATALESSVCSRVLLVSCDMPFLSVPLLRWMKERPDEYDALVPTTQRAGLERPGVVFQTLHAIYHRSCLSQVIKALERGERTVYSFYPNVHVHEVTASSARVLDPGLWTFFSINTPNDLAIAKLRIEGTLQGDNPQIGDR